MTDRLLASIPSILIASSFLFGCSLQLGGDDETSGSGGRAGSSGAGGSSAGSGGSAGNSGCAPGEERFEGRCVDPVLRYEPAARIDFNNVVAYGALPTELDLPDPPKSGFRLVVPPIELEPGGELSRCVAWAYPEMTHRHVYAARLYTTGGLHHSNMYGTHFHNTLGPSPYPDCNPGQSDLYSKAAEILAGIIPDVLFANSTQIVGGESIVFAPGMAYELTVAGQEVATSIHFLNTSNDRMKVEVVYDFFTMPEQKVTTPLVPYYFDNFAFQVEPQSEAQVSTTCEVFGGNLVSIMPHTHSRARGFTVDLLAADGTERRIFDAGDFDVESDIEVFPDPISLADTKQIRHVCTIQNELSKPINYGLGDDEMCTLFGYMYPPSAQVLGIIDQGGSTCAAFNIGKTR